MSYPGTSDRERPKMEAVYDFARAMTVYGTPILLGFIGLYLVFQAFGHGFATGVRSLASFLFPVVIASFLYVFNRELLKRLGDVSPAAGFVIGLAMGIVLMVVFEVMLRRSGIPLSELVVSGCFSVLVFSAASSSEAKVFTYYYGTLSGLLLYVIVRGVPSAA